MQTAKERAGRVAADLVHDGMHVGLGTGSTVHYTIVALGERALDIVCVATSQRTFELAQSLGLRVLSPDEAGPLDIAIDGADEVDERLNLIKGGGGAHLREKVIADMADQFVVVIDESKLVPSLGAFGVPLEVLDFAPEHVERRLAKAGAERVVRNEARTDNGNLSLRAWFGPIDDPPALAIVLAEIPGVIEHGMFLCEMVDRVIVATDAGHVREILR